MSEAKPTETAEKGEKDEKKEGGEDKQEKPEEDYSNEDSVFSLKRPKDIREGLGQGVGNILKGALGGAALLVSAPIKGAYDGGNSSGSWGAVKGFGAGLGIGVVGGMTMIVGGAVTGVAQIGRGIYNTPGSISAMSAGKEWDEEKREWIIYNLEEEAKLILTMSEEDFLKSIKHVDPAAKEGAEGETVREARKVADTEFYDVLGVPTNALPADIKKAYYKKARDSHPDRHPDDPEAHAKFQTIGHAYQVLSDEALRANYDASGKDSVETAPKVDPSTLFAMIFGSEKFVPLVGELKVASQMQAEETEQSVPKLKKFRQKKREVQCAVNLAQKLQPYIDGNENAEAFKASLAEELKELSGSPFGSTLVGTIGLAYYEAAVAELSTVDGLTVGFAQSARSVTTGFSIASEGVQAALVANEVSKAQKLKKLKEEQQQQKAAAGTATAATNADGTPIASSTPASASTSAASVTPAAQPQTPAQQAATAAAQAEEAKVDEAAMKEKIERLSGHMFTVMWHFTDMDIRSTLASVCYKVLRDHSVSAEVLTKRAKALKLLGELFIAKGGSLAAGLGDVRSRLHNQMNGSGAGAGAAGANGPEGATNAEAGAAASTPAAAAESSGTPASNSPTPAAAPAMDSSNLD